MVLYEEKLYGTLSPRESSNYQAFSKAHRYAYIELKIRNKLYVLQPIDFLGEEELKDGKYTYQLNVGDTSSQSRRLDLTFKKDWLDHFSSGITKQNHQAALRDL